MHARALVCWYMRNSQGHSSIARGTLVRAACGHAPSLSRRNADADLSPLPFVFAGYYLFNMSHLAKIVKAPIKVDGKVQAAPISEIEEKVGQALLDLETTCKV